VRNSDHLHNILLIRADKAHRKFNATVMDSLKIFTKLPYKNREVVVDGSADLVVRRGNQMRNKEKHYIGTIRLQQLWILAETIRCRRTGVNGWFSFWL
jgi:hypothetical protein